MKASEMVKNLNKLIEECGDLELVYSSDDEGNNFDKVYHEPTPGYYEAHEFSNGDEDDDINSFCIN